MRPILVLNGPNLNLLGQREPEIYGSDTLADVERLCANSAAAHGLTVITFQSNHEGAIVDRIQACRGKAAGIVINAGAYTHTSVAILDALMAAEVPAIEVHISNIHKRDAFRHHSYISAAAAGIVVGFGIQGYVLALKGLAGLLEGKKP